MPDTESYDYAFINSSSVVVNICVFDEKNLELIEAIKNDMGATLAICCNDFGLAAVGGTWDGQFFRYSDGTRVPPTHMPEDDNYIYKFNFDSNEWVVVTTNKLKNI
jgi:hypothetical protein